MYWNENGRTGSAFHFSFLRNHHLLRTECCGSNKHTARFKSLRKIIMQNNYYRNDAPPNRSITERFSPDFWLLLFLICFRSAFSTLPDTAFTSLHRPGKRGLEPGMNLYSHDTTSEFGEIAFFSEFKFEKNMTRYSVGEKKSMLPRICSHITRTNFDGIHFTTFTYWLSTLAIRYSFDLTDTGKSEKFSRNVLLDTFHA